MKISSGLMAFVVLSVLCAAEVFAGPRILGRMGKTGGARNEVRRYWKPAVPVVPHGPHFRWHHGHPYAYHRHNPRSVIVITPTSYYPYDAPVALVTSEPFYCHVHQVGFVSRVGFLDHISGTHKVPLATANAICAYGTESCIIEGY